MEKSGIKNFVKKMKNAAKEVFSFWTDWPSNQPQEPVKFLESRYIKLGRGDEAIKAFAKAKFGGMVNKFK
jgi:hypothetical protein